MKCDRASETYESLSAIRIMMPNSAHAPSTKALRALVALLATASWVALGGCSEDSSSSSSGGQSGSVTCENDSRVSPYSANMARDGEKGALRFMLQSIEPAPPTKGNSRWMVRVTDTADAPMAGGTLTADPRMPDHGHGSSVTPTVTDKGDGGYEVNPIYFMMPGVWDIQIDATVGGKTDTAHYVFCVGG